MKYSLIAICYMAAFASCNLNNNRPNINQAPVPTYQDAKLTLKQTEESAPTQFITTSGTYRQNFINQWVMEGTITNKASVAVFKDVVVKFTYYSKTDTELGAEQKVFYDYYHPNERKEFKVKSNGFAGTSKISFTIIDATATN